MQWTWKRGKEHTKPIKKKEMPNETEEKMEKKM